MHLRGAVQFEDGDTGGNAATDTGPDMTERVAFAELFHDHYPRVMRLAHLHCGDRARAEDAVAEAMAKVFVRWRAGRVEHVGAYLRRAVVNEILQDVRRRASADRARARSGGDVRGVRDATEDLADRDELVMALQRLPDRQRLAVVLRYYEQLTEGETAEVMGIGVGGVKSQTSRGLARLRDELRAVRKERS